MYGWIWRALPFGLRGKLIGSLVLLASVVILLWFVLFPIIEPIMPFNNVQMPASNPTSAPVPSTAPS
jgi:hypothetical protein